MRIYIDNQLSEELPDCFSSKDLALKLHLTQPHQAVSVTVNGKVTDLDQPLQDKDRIHFLSFEEEEGKEVFWHTSAHVLAQAILRLFPEALPTIGPPIEHGFYYDFANLTLSDADFERIEEEVEKILKANYTPERYTFSSKEEALERFVHNPFKVELIQGFEEGPLTAYQQGEFFDLCRGPHMPQLGKIKAFKILKTSGAYWRGDSKNQMLTRIYGISFPEKKLLKEYLAQIEEAKKRDHKVIGPRLGLFSLKEQAPGMPFIHPKGMIFWNNLLGYWRECHQEAGYVEIKTPVMMTKELWETSGHWQNYRHNMYTTHIEERDFAIKPMNCPGCILYYQADCHSYREFPLRIAEIGHVHRYEASGALSGLFRVRAFHQDDAHIFLMQEQIEDEICHILKIVKKMYTTFGLPYHFELSTRPEENTIGSDEDWEAATNGLRNALERQELPYKINEGDGAFYGPKIDIHIRDAIGRTWQCGTIQLDFALPQRFELEYTASDGSKKSPVMLHRVIFGSVERFMGILIEHFAGRFPAWLSPIQARLLTVADRHLPYAKEVQKSLLKAGIRCDIDSSDESLSKKVRLAQMEQINYIITLGDQELTEKTIALRTRNNRVVGSIELEPFIATLLQEIQTRSLKGSFDD